MSWSGARGWTLLPRCLFGDNIQERVISSECGPGTSDSYLVITRVQSQPSHLSDHHVEISARCEEFAVFEPLEFLSFHF